MSARLPIGAPASARGAVAALAWALGLLTSTAAHAQASPAPFMGATRYDAMGRVTGTLAPDPDGAGSLKHLATRTTYDARGNPIKVETGEVATWQSEAVAPAAWTGFTIYKTLESTYDAMGRKLTDQTKGSDLVAVSLTQYRYDSSGRLECTATRMNPATYGSLPSSACTLGTEGGFGPDRIVRNIYDAAGQLLQVREGVGTSIEAAEATYGYTLNGKRELVIDANGNRAKLEYDGFDRQVRWVFPSPTRPSSYNDSTPANALASAGSLNTGDYEQYGYDANGNRTSLRKRDGSTLAYSYDALNRATTKVVPERSGLATTHTRDVYYGYDLRGLQTFARFDSGSGEGVTTGYDGFGRKTSESLLMDGVARTIGSGYNGNSARVTLTYPDGNVVNYYRDGLDRLYYADRAGADPLFYPVYGPTGVVASLARYKPGTGWHHGNSFGYNTALRLDYLGHSFSNSSYSASTTFAYNPAGQMTSASRNNDAFAWTGHVNVDRDYATNGLNQYTAAGSAGFTYDANGNLTSDGTNSYIYDVENRLVSRSGGGAAALRYDPLGRLYEVAGGTLGTQRFAYDGDALIAEYDGAGTMLRRYVHGPNAAADDPLVWYEGGAMSSAARRDLFVDERGSIVAVTDANGTASPVNAYDEYGIPDDATTASLATKGRFRYTGQALIPELGLYYYKARFYSPTLGRFMQTDPIGYEDQVNLYAYVGNDPVNGVDPTGNAGECPDNKRGCAATAATAATAVGAREGLGAERARAQYKESVSKLAPNDTEGRSAAKASARAATPPITRGVVEGTRPGLGPKPGSGGTANRTSAGADRLAGRLGTAGRVAGVAGVAVGVARVATSENPGQEAARVGGGIAGAIAGAEAGATVGALGGPWGAAAGGVIGGIAGGFLGEKAVDELIDW